MTDHIIKAAREAGFDWADLGVQDRLAFARFYAIAYRQGMERAAEMFAGQPHVEHFGREIADAIRAEAHAQNQTEGRATNG